MNSVLMVAIGVPVWFLQMLTYSVYTSAVDISKSKTNSDRGDSDEEYSLLHKWAKSWALEKRKLNHLEALAFLVILLSGLVIFTIASGLESFDLLAYVFLIPWGVVYVQEIIVAIWTAASRRR
jgi:hypothetical protein